MAMNNECDQIVEVNKKEDISEFTIKVETVAVDLFQDKSSNKGPTIDQWDGVQFFFDNKIEEKVEDENYYKLHIKHEAISCIEDKLEFGNLAFIKPEEITVKDDKEDSNNLHEDYNQFYHKCKYAVIKDTPIPMGIPGRAAQTIPEDAFELRPSVENGLGVYALKDLIQGLQLGPYEGKTTKVESSEGCCWKLNNGRLVDTSDEGECNYLVYVDYARDASEQNLVPFQFEGKLYYRTCRDVKKDEKLVIFFSENLAEEVYYRPPVEHFEGEFYMCHFCHKGLKIEEELLNCHKNICQNNPVALEGHACVMCGRTSWEGCFDIEKGDKHEQKKLFQCTKCISRHHIQNNGKEKSFQCTDCELKFKTKYYLEKHKQEHNSEILLKCTDCDYENSSRYNLMRHRKKHKPKNFIECTFCNFKTYYKSVLERHKLTHERNDVLKCIECDYETYCQNNLYSHKRRHNRKYLYKCEDCDYESFCKAFFKRHRRKHEQKNLIKCTLCDFETYYKHALNRHKSKHEPKNMFKCIDCDYKTHCKENLTLHKQKHDPNSLLKCPDCNYENFCKANMKKHRRKHEQKNLKCTICNFTTYYKQALDLHKFKHEEKKILKCTDCDYETYCKPNLDIHRRRHNLKNLNKCTYCNYETYYKNAFDKHISKHELKNLWRCAECDYKTHSKENVIVHRQKHATNNLFKCPDCNYGSFCKANLKRHRRKHEQKNLKGTI